MVVLRISSAYYYIWKSIIVPSQAHRVARRGNQSKTRSRCCSVVKSVERCLFFFFCFPFVFFSSPALFAKKRIRNDRGARRVFSRLVSYVTFVFSSPSVGQLCVHTRKLFRGVPHDVFSILVYYYFTCRNQIDLLCLGWWIYTIKQWIIRMDAVKCARFTFILRSYIIKPAGSPSVHADTAHKY